MVCYYTKQYNTICIINKTLTLRKSGSFRPQASLVNNYKIIQNLDKKYCYKRFSKNTVNKCMTTGTLCVIILVHIQNNKNNRQWFKLNKPFKQTCYTEMLNNSLNKYSLSQNF